MKKVIFLFIVTAFILVIPVICFSQEVAEQKDTATAEKAMPEKAMMPEGMMQKHMMMQQEKMGQMCPMQGMMMKAMTEKSMVVTKDGGVVVLIGNKLLKYDKNLNLIKEVEIIKIDKEAMKEKMMQLKEKCSQHMEMMQDEPTTEEGAAKE